MNTYLSIITRSLAVVILSLTSINGNCQKIASLEVNLTKETYGLNIPVSINLDNVTYLSDTLLALYEVRNKSKTAVTFQIEEGNPRKLSWMMETGTNPGEKHLYELVQGRAKQSDVIIASADDGSLVIHSGNKNFLQYNFKTVYPPKGVDTAYKRSGFIHPLWSPHGQVLTRIQPPGSLSSLWYLESLDTC